MPHFSSKTASTLIKLCARADTEVSGYSRSGVCDSPAFTWAPRYQGVGSVGQVPDTGTGVVEALFDPGLIRVNLCSLLGGKNFFGSLLRLLAPPISSSNANRGTETRKSFAYFSDTAIVLPTRYF